MVDQVDRIVEQFPAAWCKSDKIQVRCPGPPAGANQHRPQMGMFSNIRLGLLDAHHKKGGCQRIGLRGRGAEHRYREDFLGGPAGAGIEQVTVPFPIMVKKLVGTAGRPRGTILER